MSATSHAMQPIEQLADYCGNGNPVIVQEFRAGWGWVRTSFRKRASYAWLRKLRAEGVSWIGIEVEPGTSRVADFRIDELLKVRPLLGGRLI